ncbi:MAG: hypothetical protein KOO62_01780 [candidate division Zixibacteria bacterium]|nr:hypothetical protein [candidate division Zixibacteria bacterium]
MNRFLITIILMLGFLVKASLTVADVPQMINYQGYLTNDTGTPVADDTYFIKFKIYGSDSSDDSLWWSGIQAVPVAGGLFTHQLGSAAHLPDDLFKTDTIRYLGITVGADPEISPRVHLITVPYAYKALRSDSADYADNSGNLNSQAASYYLEWSNLTGIPADIADGDDVDTDWNNLTNVPPGFADGTDDVNSDWNDLTNVPAGFADGTDDVDTDWNNLTNVPPGFADGTDDVDTDWNNLTNVPPGFADGTDDVDTDWNNLTNVPPGFADGVDDNSGGDITAVTAGSGLSGGGTSGDVSLYVGTDDITATHIAADAVGSSEIDDNSITQADIATDGVGVAEIATNAVGSVEIIDNSIAAKDIAANAVGPSEIAINAVGSGEIIDNSITANDIATDGVGGAEIAAGAVGTSEIANNSITQADIDADAVGSSEIAISAVYSAEIANNSILDEDINSSANIGIAKISGTAVNLSSTQTITGTKTFDGTAVFGDSSMRVTSYGIRMGDNGFPSASYLLSLEREYNTISTRYVFDLYSKNVATSGTIYGIFSSVDNANASSGDRYAGRFFAGGVSNTAGNSYGIKTNAYGGVTAYGIFGSASYASANNYGGYFTPGHVKSPGSYAGYFDGDVEVTGFSSAASSGFKIDHPLDPKNQYLIHSDVVSPEMMNIYNGNVTTDGSGEATVTLPDYFEALNDNYRYQLTVIGTFAQAIVAEKINGNKFVIKTDKSFIEVSWQVTGIRKDAFAKSNRMLNEISKPDKEIGLYLHPTAFDLDESMQIHYEQNKEILESYEDREDR